MQVNSTQDWLTRYKRRVLAKSFNLPQQGKTNSVYLSVEANHVTQRERFVAPFQGVGGRIGGATYSSECCTVSGAFAGTARHSVVRFNVIPALSYRATTVRS